MPHPSARHLALAAGTALVAAGVLASCTFTRPFLDARGRPLPHSVATMERVSLNGADQAVWFRARDVRNPPLVLLHGGPGASEAALFRHYVPALEDHFLVVYWEQRGAGRSYHPGLDPTTLTVAQLLADLDALVDTVRARYGHDRVVLLGHSWGTALGTLYAHGHPDKVAAYAGVAQITDFAEGEEVSLAWATREAERRGDARALRTLRAMAPRPASVDDELALGRVVEHYTDDVPTGALIWAALRTDEANLVDLWRFGQGNRVSLDALRPEYERLDLTRYRRFAIPVVFLLGRRDWHVPSTLAAEYLDALEAPCKRLVWFEDSAHNPPFSEPDAFVRALVDTVSPLAVAGCPSAEPLRNAPPRRALPVIPAAPPPPPERDLAVDYLRSFVTPFGDGPPRPR